VIRLQSAEFEEVWCADFEFTAAPGERPLPICLVAHEVGSGRTLRLWEDELRRLDRPPYSIGKRALFVAYYASAELGCHLALGWPMPVNVLDLFIEFRNQTNGQPTPCGAGLLGALTFYGLDGIDVAEKDDMRVLALRGGPWTEPEQWSLLAYCEADVVALTRLLPRMLPALDIPRALLRGRYMKAVACIEARGIPIDKLMLGSLRDRWEAIKDRLIEQIDADYGVFDGRTFKAESFARWLATKGIPWPRLQSGSLALDDDTTREMARVYPEIAPIRELRVSLSQLRLEDLAVSSDGRNRCLLSAFRTNHSMAGKRTAKSSSTSTGFHGFFSVLEAQSVSTASSGCVGSVTTAGASPSRRRGSDKATSSFEPARKRSIGSWRRDSPRCRRLGSGSQPTAASASR
jgi:DNA polymerase I